MYTRSLVIAQAGSTAIYLTIAVVVYYYCGSYVASPALGSAGPLIKRISYGIALPGLIVTTTLFIHVSLMIMYQEPVSMLISRIAARQVPLRPIPQRIQTSHSQHLHPLGNLARLHFRQRHRLIPHR